ncbi:hypothetical protein [Paenibacillus sp. 481]|nr:hypothetical protein [Paenibacillus sp. 481]
MPIYCSESLSGCKPLADRAYGYQPHFRSAGPTPSDSRHSK